MSSVAWLSPDFTVSLCPPPRLFLRVDHWNNDLERLALVTDNSLLVFKYDFVLFNCERFLRIPLNFVDRISYGAFSFPKASLLK